MPGNDRLVKQVHKPDVAVDAGDTELLKLALEGVQPLTPPNRAKPLRQKPRPIVRLDERGDQKNLLTPLDITPSAPETGQQCDDALIYRSNGLSQQHLRKLRRGHWKTQDNLDLHGMTIEQAHQLTSDFLSDAIRQGLRCVRIVHGKGLRSPNREPVIKKNLAAWLQQWKEILAYCQAPPAEGGSGAVLVLLREKASR